MSELQVSSRLRTHTATESDWILPKAPQRAG